MRESTFPERQDNKEATKEDRNTWISLKTENRRDLLGRLGGEACQDGNMRDWVKRTDGGGE